MEAQHARSARRQGRRQTILLVSPMRGTKQRERGLRRIAIVLFAVATLGCATTGLTPISDPAQRVEAPGVSVLPPRGDNWDLFPASRGERIPPGATLIRFVKRLPQSRVRAGWLTYTGVFALDLGEKNIRDADEFLQHFREEFRGGEGVMLTHRQRLVSFEANLDDSLKATCARYARLTEFRDPAEFGDAILLVATRGFFCWHPHWPRYAINVLYTQRYPTGQNPLALDDEVGAFLSSAIFPSSRPIALP